MSKSRNFGGLTGLLAVALALVSLLTACGNSDNNSPVSAVTGGQNQAAAQGQNQTQANATSGDKKPVRIGYQKGGSLVLLKSQGTLEKRLGGPVQWVEFTAGPPLLEALNTGSIDFGSTGNAPPVFAQAAGAPLVYVASDVGDPTSQGIIVPANSPIKTVADLKGKKIAYNKGSSAHYILVTALQEVGLKYTDVESVFLSPGDARVAFETGKVDAWVIWDPFYTVARHSSDVRVIRDATGISTRGFYLASRSFINDRADDLKTLLSEIQRVEDWSKTRPDEVAKFIAPQIGVDLAIEQEITRRAKYNFTPIDDTIIAEQQKVADTFYNLGLIPKKLNIKEAAWIGTWPAPPPQ